MTSDFAADLTRLWTRAYTSGLDPALRDARRAEIESDLWESQQDCDAQAQVLPRLLGGVIDDLCWRMGHMSTATVSSLWRLAATCLALVAMWQWLLNAPTILAIRHSAWVFQVVETLHVLGLCLFLGLTVMLDLRLIGATMRTVRVSEIVRSLMPWAAGGAALAVVSGMLVYMSDPTRYYDNLFFRIKAAVLVLAILNTWLFHAITYQRVREWDLAPVPPMAARVAGYVSLALWGSVVVSGRLTAYNWFD